MDLETASPRLRRAYFECRYGQLHVHNAIPAGGGFDEQTTLICLHGAGNTGRMFLALSAALGKVRSVYSPDIPGFGESDAPPGTLPITGYAEAIGDFLDSMRFRRVDLLGVDFGAGVAAEIAIARPKLVRRVATLGAPSPGDWKAEPRLALVQLPMKVVHDLAAQPLADFFGA
jgi:pimeloyl-ACP methyl ester carboxylesterase